MAQMLYLFHKGESSNTLYASYFNGTWTGNSIIAQLPGGIVANSNDTPAAVSYRNMLYLIYKQEGSNTLWAAHSDGLVWDQNLPIASWMGGINAKSASTPAVAVFQDNLYMVYRNDSSNDLYVAWYDGSRWHGNQAIVSGSGDPHPKSDVAPALAVYNNRLYLVNKGQKSSTVWMLFYDGATWHDNQPISKMAGFQSPKTDVAPAIANYNNRLYLVNKGDGSTKLWMLYFDGTSWHDNQLIGDMPGKQTPASQAAPALAVYNNRLYLVNKGENSTSFWSLWFDGITWHDNQSIPEQPGGITPKSSAGPAVCVGEGYDRSRWMSADSARLGTRTLKQIVMPGSHDAGTSQFTQTSYGEARNTRTQTLSIGQQLLAGSRYFDIRPVRFRTGVGGPITWATGHYTIEPLKVMVGATGETLPTIFNALANFLANSRELVIFKFGHYIDQQAAVSVIPNLGVSNVGDDYFDGLCKLIHDSLSPYLYIPPAGTDVASLQFSGRTLESFFKPGDPTGRVLPVLDSLPTKFRTTYPGIYSYADFPGAGVIPSGGIPNLMSYDSYSATSDLNTMVKGQLDKLRATANHGENLFLLSWTLTMGGAQSIFETVLPTFLPMTSIIDYAGRANAVLWKDLAAAYGFTIRQPDNISRSIMPNVLYLDDFGTFATDTAVWLNAHLTPT